MEEISKTNSIVWFGERKLLRPAQFLPPVTRLPLIKLLVVIPIIAILASSCRRYQSKARTKRSCLNNLKQLH
jgi:hypothetical protein